MSATLAERSNDRFGLASLSSHKNVRAWNIWGMGMQRAGGISGGSLCSICCLRKWDQRTPHPNCLMRALISNDKLKPGESVSSFCKQLGEQGLLCVYNISRLFLASSIWLVRSLEPRLKHVLSKCYPDLPKLWIACSYTYPKETELMVQENVMLAFYARVQITMYPHLLQHFFFFLIWQV